MQTTQLKNIETKDCAALDHAPLCVELNELQLSLVGGGNADISLN